MTEEYLTQRIFDCSKQLGIRSEQRFEVAAKFYYDALSLFRRGMVELAERKAHAAENVLNGHGDA